MIPAKHKYAWVFSNGLASVYEDGVIKFIDTKDNIAFDREVAYKEDMDGYVFHDGYCIVDSDGDDKYGLINTKGETVVPEEYHTIRVTPNMKYWTLVKGDESGVYDRNLKPIIPMMECWMFAGYTGIEVIMPDNTMRWYDYNGKLVQDFCIKNCEPMEYDTEETYQSLETYTDDDGDEHEYLSEPRNKTARARLFKYEAGNNMCGLMTQDGHFITMPLYKDIQAVGPDMYLCEIGGNAKVLVDGKGNVVK